MLQRPVGKKACAKDTDIGSMGVSALVSYTKNSIFKHTESKQRSLNFDTENRKTHRKKAPKFKVPYISELDIASSTMRNFV